MKDRIFSLLGTFLFLTSILTSCTEKKDKGDEVLIKDLSRALNIISEKNDQHYQKLKKYYEADTSRKDIQLLHQQLFNIKQYKEEYKTSILEKNSVDLEQATKLFIEKSFTQLDESEKTILLRKFEDSPVLNPALIREMGNTAVLPYELALESEIITEEIYKLILKDFSKRHQEFKWEIFW